jgi:hypothetical protein
MSRFKAGLPHFWYGATLSSYILAVEAVFQLSQIYS